MAKLQDLDVVISLDTSRLTRGIRVAEGQFKKLERAGQRLRSIGAAFAPISLAIAGLGAVSVKAFASFDDAMTKSLAIMGDVSNAMREDMGQAAKDVSRNTTFSATQAAESFFFLASAGLDAKQSIEALPVVSRFAQAGAFDLARATDLLTDAQSAMGLTIRDDAVKNMLNMARVSDVLVRANTLANATVEQFSTALTSKAGAALKSFNIDIEEGVAVLAAFADQGVKAELAGNALDRILRLLPKAATENAKAFKELGITVFDEQGNLRNLGLIIGDLERALAGMTDQQKFAALEALGFEARVQAIIKPLLGTSDAIARYEKELRKAAGTTEDVADKQLKSFSAQMKLLRNRLDLAAQDLGEKLAPVIEELGQEVIKLAEAFTRLDASTQKNILVIGGITAALSPLLLVVGSLTIAVSELSRAFLVLGRLAIKHPLGALLTVAGLLAAAFLTFSDRVDLAEEAHQRYGDALERINKLLERNKELTGQAREENEKLTQSAIDQTRAIVLADLAKARAELERQQKIVSQFGGREPSPAFLIAKNEVALLEKEIQGLNRALGDLNLAEGELKLEGLAKGFEKTGEAADKASGSVGAFVDRLTAKELGLDPLDVMVAKLEAGARAFENLQQQAQGIFENTRTPLEKFNAAIAKATQLRKLFPDIIDEETFRRFVEQQTEILQSFSEKTVTVGSIIEDTFQRAGRAMADAIGHAVAFGSDALESLANIARSVLSQIISGLIRIGLSSLGGPFETIFGFGGGRAFGGPVQPGKIYNVGERGPERFVPTVPGEIIPNDELGGGGGKAPLQIIVNGGLTPVQFAEVFNIAREAAQDVAIDVLREAQG